jgi:uncharacterized protein
VIAARQIVLKLASRCNLACSYCYMYEAADQSWRRRPKVMSPDTVKLTADRVGEHVAAHALDAIGVVLHGGEPLLAGHRVVRSALVALRAAAPAAIRFSAQTNGILIDDRYLEIFAEFGVRVGVSLDGDAGSTDRNRRYADGRGSYGLVLAGLDRLRRHEDLYAGLLCTIDVRNDPLAVYRSLRDLAPPAIDLLLPHGNWTHPPPRPPGCPSYAEWLIAVFDAWYDEPAETTRIRLFESIISRLLGGESLTEAIGGDRGGIVTVETDGEYEQSDALKTAAEGVAATDMHLATHSLDDVLAGLATIAPPVVAARCAVCPVFRICGGGLRAHRWSAERAFDNPSIFCDDLMTLIGHIAGRVRADLEAAT